MRIFYIYLFFIVSFCSFGQISTSDNPFIEVTGVSQLEVSPNEIHIDLCLEEYMKDDEKITLSILETDLKNELSKANIPESNLYISDINSVITKTGWFSKETLSTGNYSLKVTEVQKIKEVFNIFEKLNILEANITKATHSNIVELRKQNRIKAIKEAKEKADYLLEAIGSKTGKPLKVIEEANTNANYANYANFNYNSIRRESYNSISKTKGNNRNVQFENIKIISTIHVIFQIA